MKKIFYVLAIGILLISCTSQESKIKKSILYLNPWIENVENIEILGKTESWYSGNHSGKAEKISFEGTFYYKDGKTKTEERDIYFYEDGYVLFRYEKERWNKINR